MDTNTLENKELGLSFLYWNAQKKTERVFLASQIMKQLGYTGRANTLQNYDLDPNLDVIKITKKQSPDFFRQLVHLKCIGSRASSVIMLYESGVWKLIMQSRKEIGIKTRNWLAREVLPSIVAKGYYNVSEAELNPFSYLHEFTERTKQIENSKNVASKAKECKLSYSETYNKIHKLVVGKTAKEIKKMFKSKESARELLRKNLPEYACTEAVIDELFTKFNKSLSDIQKSQAQSTLPPAFKSLYELGVNFNLDVKM